MQTAWGENDWRRQEMAWHENVEYEDETAWCAECGALFFRKTNERWKRVCLDCWIAQKEKQGGRREQRREQREPPGHRSEPSSDGSAIPVEMLRRLLQLCHPDKHGDSESAVKATQWLLKQRKPR